MKIDSVTSSCKNPTVIVSIQNNARVFHLQSIEISKQKIPNLVEYQWPLNFDEATDEIVYGMKSVNTYSLSH